MPCNFSASRLSGEDRVLLTHLSQGATDPGFGAAQLTSKVRLTGPGHNNTDLSCPIWTALAIVANLPANLSLGTYTISVEIVGPPPCTASAQMQLLAGDVVSDLAFAAASPAIAELGATVEIVNTKPGFTWEQPKHEPVDLLKMSGDVAAPKPQVTDGWGTQRLKVKLPGPGDYTMTDPIQAHLFRFDGHAQTVPITLKALSVDPIALAVLVPPVVEAGQTLRLINVIPGFTWSETNHKMPKLFDQDGAFATSQPTYLSGWGTQELVIKLPPRDQFPTAEGLFPAHLKFDGSPHKFLFSVSKLPEVKPQKLHVGRLTCQTTEDWTGADECRLEVKIDNLPFLPLPVVSLNNGEFHDFDVDFVFLSRAEARLFDEDSGILDSDDLLGSATLKPGKSPAKFTGDGADYTLTYDITSVL